MSDDLDGPKATNPTGEAKNEVLHLDFDRRVMVQFRGSVVTSDAGLLAYRELDDVLGLSDLAGERLADGRTGKNSRHALVGMLRQSVFGRLAGYEVRSSVISSIRTNLIRKGIVFSPSSGTIAFRIPLADRYIRTHASFFFNDAAQSYMTGLASRTR